MIENNETPKNNKANYRNMVSQMGKKEFTLLKMQEYGFWPKDLPTPYEKQKNESPEDFSNRKILSEKYIIIIDKITQIYTEKEEIQKKLWELKKQYNNTWDYEKIRKDIAQKIMKESIARRAERKKQKELAKQKRSKEWLDKKSNEIIFIGKGYSNLLNKKEYDEKKLLDLNIPVIATDKDLATFLNIEYKTLRLLTYHRDVVELDNYYRYTIPKKKGGLRNIAAPKPILKNVQRSILDNILKKISISDFAHGFIDNKSVITSAKTHGSKPDLVINMDLENFFPSISFIRICGVFMSFGYSGYISSLFSMLCSYSERTVIEIKGKNKYVKTSDRILPQGSPASPMITNIICNRLDKRLNGISAKFGLTYTRYADDISFSIKSIENFDTNKFCGIVNKIIKDEGFKVNKAKTRFLRKNNRQIITGIVVNNEEISIPRKWVKNLRAAIHNAKIAKESNSLSLAKKNELSGMINWLKSVNNNRYSKILENGNKIIDS